MTIPHTRPTFTDVTVTGTPEQIGQALAPLHDAGRLIGMTAPRPVSTTDQRQTLRARVRTDVPGAVDVTVPTSVAPARPRVGVARPPWLPVAVGAGVFIAVAVAGFWIGASGIATHLIATVASVIGGVGALFLLASALTRIGSGTGHHCPGCPHH
jgi:hypothetical protein